MANATKSKTQNIKPPKRVNFATYPQDYYSGSQVKILFGSVWVDDIATIQYQSTQGKTPLYGYADQQFRAVAKGQFLVNGQFTIAFKETGYLNIIMEMIRNENRELYRVLDQPKTKDSKISDTFFRYMQQGVTPEEAMDLAANQGKSNFIRYSDNNRARAENDFEDIAEVMEDAIWGRADDTSNSRAVLGKKIPRSDELDYYKHTGRGVSKSIDVGGFDILITFGNFTTGYDTPEHTVIALNDVHIRGESLVVTPAGEPIGMTYDFFARGLNERVSYAWPDSDQKQAKTGQEKDTDTKSPNAQDIEEFTNSVDFIRLTIDGDNQDIIVEDLIKYLPDEYSNSTKNIDIGTARAMVNSAINEQSFQTLPGYFPSERQINNFTNRTVTSLNGTLSLGSYADGDLRGIRNIVITGEFTPPLSNMQFKVNFSQPLNGPFVPRGSSQQEPTPYEDLKSDSLLPSLDPKQAPSYNTRGNSARQHFMTQPIDGINTDPIPFPGDGFIMPGRKMDSENYVVKNSIHSRILKLLMLD